MKFIDPRTDFAFKKIFGSTESKEILLNFLNSIMGLPADREILDLTIVDPYQLPKIGELKYSILDVKCVDKRGITYVVEMQLLEVEAFHKRVVYNVCKAYAGQLGLGVGYPELNQVVGITITDFVLFEDLPAHQYISRHLLKEDLGNGHYMDEIIFYFVELPKFKKELYELETITEKWVYFLRHTASLEVIPAELNVPPIDKAFAIASRSAMNGEELEIYEKYMMAKQDEIGSLRVAERRGEQRGREIGKKQGIEIGEQRGIEKGKEEEKKLMAKELLKLGKLSPEEISKITGLAQEELEELRE